MSSRIVVRGNTTKNPILLDTEEGQVIEFYDADGEIMVVFGRMGGEGDNWIMANRNDDDWDSILRTLTDQGSKS